MYPLAGVVSREFYLILDSWFSDSSGISVATSKGSFQLKPHVFSMGPRAQGPEGPRKTCGLEARAHGLDGSSPWARGWAREYHRGLVLHI